MINFCVQFAKMVDYQGDGCVCKKTLKLSNIYSDMSIERQEKLKEKAPGKQQNSRQLQTKGKNCQHS
jgi:hypothetical protein